MSDQHYVYIGPTRDEPLLRTVGFYRPDGKWEPESDHETDESAAARVAYLNGGPTPQTAALASLREQLAETQRETAPCRLCHCCLDAPDRHGEILGEWVVRAESAERELAALKAQGACETCKWRGAVLGYDGECRLLGLMCAEMGNRCGRWTPVAPTPEG